MSIFLCPHCGCELKNFPKCNCGHTVEKKSSVYLFSSIPSSQIMRPEKKYLAYRQDTIENHRFAMPSYYRYCTEKLIQIVNSHPLCMDLGIGFDNVPLILAEHDINTIAVDLSQEVLSCLMQKARQKQLQNQITAVQMNAYQLMLADQSIDIAIVNKIYMMVSEPDAILQEVYRVLKPGGYIAEYTCDITQNDTSTLYDIVYNQLVSTFEKTLNTFGYQAFWNDNLPQTDTLFEPPIKYSCKEEYLTITIDELAERLQYQGWNRYQHIPLPIYNKAWTKTDECMKSIYGENYRSISKNIIRYSHLLLYQKK